MKSIQIKCTGAALKLDTVLIVGQSFALTQKAKTEIKNKKFKILFIFIIIDLF